MRHTMPICNLQSACVKSVGEKKSRRIPWLGFLIMFSNGERKQEREGGFEGRKKILEPPPQLPQKEGEGGSFLSGFTPSNKTLIIYNSIGGAPSIRREKKTKVEEKIE